MDKQETQIIDYTLGALDPIEEIDAVLGSLRMKLNMPVKLKFAVAGGVGGLALNHIFKGSRNSGVIAAILGGMMASKLGEGRELTADEKRYIQAQIKELEVAKHQLEIQQKASETGTIDGTDMDELDFERIGFKGIWRSFMGNPTLDYHAMLWGEPKSGKSILSLRFADYFANNHGDVIYIAAEEGFKGTMKEKINNWTTNRKNITYCDYVGFEKIQHVIKDFDHVIIDSLHKAQISDNQLEELKKQDDRQSFTTVQQMVKSGTFRGSKEYEHNADMLIEVKRGGDAEQIGRFLDGVGKMNVFADLT